MPRLFEEDEDREDRVERDEGAALELDRLAVARDLPDRDRRERARR
jgi:hypothetical protein